MAKHDDRRTIRIYHALVAILILLAGGALLGLGIWMTLTSTGGPLNLEYAGDSFFNIVLSANIGAMVLGGFLLFTGLVSLIALAKEWLGVTFRILYVIMATIILAMLVLITVMSSLVITNGDKNEVKRFIEEAWERTVKNDPNTICEIENRFVCRGFKDGDCTVCKTGLEPECNATVLCARCTDQIPVNASKGCFQQILSTFKSVFLPAAIISGILSSIVLMDILLTWCL